MTETDDDIARYLVTVARIRPGSRVLDAGCEKGTVAIAAAKAAGDSGHVTGIDYSPARLRHAGAAAEAAGLGNLSFREMDVSQPELPAASFDVVLSGILAWLTSPGRTLRAWRRLLAPEGTVAFQWTLEPDSKWEPAIAAIDAHMPADVLGFSAKETRFGNAYNAGVLLQTCQYHQVQTTSRITTFTFASPEAWWDSCLSSAPWPAAWRHIRASDLEGARTEAFKLLNDLREPDGTITRTVKTAFTVARKPAGDGNRR